jgi:hypothetical protein
MKLATWGRCADRLGGMRPWYVIHVPFTNGYAPIWTVALLVAVPLAVVALIVALVFCAWFAVCPRRDDNASS